ncbi:hypothetical protein BAY61_18340 [Prauserella marina]|uniref:Uncharacterized protein n=1 Tax=Prauserella marina TaxID=530584 RepID=A0A222VRR1_9PSEU|nr:hypothetical protein BAY61_18340 [Prauserella marina]PWV74051.1 hypothetical protein DES30_108225 [Prauserella marina]SDD61770.1 hypothetical protein SAMN05421630_110226 [Prauserella marina]
MTEDGEACAAVISLDQLRFGVHSFSLSIVERLGESSAHGGAVEFESTGERVEVGRSSARACSIQGALRRSSLPVVGVSRTAKSPTSAASPVFSGQALVAASIRSL